MLDLLSLGPSPSCVVCAPRDISINTQQFHYQHAGVSQQNHPHVSCFIVWSLPF